MAEKELEIRELIINPQYAAECKMALCDFLGENCACKVSGTNDKEILWKQDALPLLMGKVLGDENSIFSLKRKCTFINEIV